jgi:hypothetical protein
MVQSSLHAAAAGRRKDGADLAWYFPPAVMPAFQEENA